LFALLPLAHGHTQKDGTKEAVLFPDIKSISKAVKTLSGKNFLHSREINSISDVVKRLSREIKRSSGDIKTLNEEVKTLSRQPFWLFGDIKTLSGKMKRYSGEIKNVKMTRSE
jgi:predicted  nucleic acid-binding Zn-ribbon protein